MSPNTKSILFTQCLQNDFVAPLGPWDPMPCLLHIGSSEAMRLVGDDPADGPVARFLDWAHRTPRENLEIVHVRDLHDPADPEQADHLEHFGSHCLAGTAGSEFVFAPPRAAGRAETVSSTTLNDFLHTGMEDTLRRCLPGVSRAGIVGAWTDAKVSFLAYELRTRYPHLEIAVCSALAASSSRERHLLALDHLERVVGVRIFHSIGEFGQFLYPEGESAPELEHRKSFLRSVEISCDAELREDDRELLAWLYRGSSKVSARCLDGGFSGNAVLAVESFDLEGRREAPHVVKIGPRAAIGQERISFETIEPILGNSAPRVADFADHGERGGIKYRYASMTGAKSRTFQSLWKAGLDDERTEEIVRTVFEEQLGRLYQAAAPEPVDLLDMWGFDAKWTSHVERSVRAVGVADPSLPWEVVPGLECPPVVPFYGETIPRSRGRMRELAPLARVHGDLNGANILIDGNRNVWLIDFFHSRKHHVLCDFAKLENDILHIWTPLETDDDLRAFAGLLAALGRVADLGVPLLDREAAGVDARFARTWSLLVVLRAVAAKFVGVFRDPWQHRIASLRYAVHTLSFDEPTGLQKKGALLNAGILARSCREHLEQDRRLRVDWIPLDGVPGALGLTILPGRLDRGRNLSEDLAVFREAGVDEVVSLVTDEELSEYGVPRLREELEDLGIGSVRFPILDQRACDLTEARTIARRILADCRAGRKVVVHCVGGIGRSGMIAACVAVENGLDAGAAISHVRHHRSPRALETQAQVDLVRELAGAR